MAKLKTPNWIRQIRDTYRMTKPVDPAIRWILPLVFIGVTGALALVGWLLQGLWLTLTATSWAWGLLATTYVFGRRAELAAYSQIEGKLGAAGEVLKTLKQGWFTTEAVEINRNQEIVHRVIGRAGVVLVIEGRPGSPIAATAKQKTARWVGETPIHEIFIGDGEGQLKLRDLNRKIRKLPKVMRPAEVTELRRKLEAVGGAKLPIPKGPMPKGMRVPRR